VDRRGIGLLETTGAAGIGKTLKNNAGDELE
jgi:hypothetical protein